MQIEENHPQSSLAITAFNHGSIEINGQSHRLPVYITDESVFPINEASPQMLDAQSFLSQCGHDSAPEIILIGTGPTHIFLHPKIIAQLAAQGIGLETMTTAAACRTFTMLQSEGRRVWAWLWP